MNPTAPTLPSELWFVGARVPLQEAPVSVAPTPFRHGRRPLDAETAQATAIPQAEKSGWGWPRIRFRTR